MLAALAGGEENGMNFRFFDFNGLVGNFVISYLIAKCKKRARNDGGINRKTILSSPCSENYVRCCPGDINPNKGSMTRDFSNQKNK